MSVGERTGGMERYVGTDLALYGAVMSRGSDLLVNLPPLALSFIRHRLKYTDHQLCKWFIDRGFNATRADIALDCMDKALNPRVAYNYRRKGHYISYAQKYNFRLADQTEDGVGILPKHGEGMTTIIGSMGSDRWMRIYDKLRQLRDQHGEIPMDRQGNPLDHLTRIEMQNRRDYADSVVYQFANDGNIELLRKILAGYITFLSPRDHRKNKYERRRATWWERIVGSESVALALEHSVQTPEKSIHWIQTQVVGTLALMKHYARKEYIDLLKNRVPSAEVKKLVAEKWYAWQKGRKEREAEQAELIQSEKDDRAIAAMNQERTVVSPTEYVSDPLDAAFKNVIKREHEKRDKIIREQNEQCGDWPEREWLLRDEFGEVIDVKTSAELAVMVRQGELIPVIREGSE